MSAISFELQVEALTGLTIASSSTNPTQAQLSTFLTDGATEIINLLPARLLDLCAASVSFTSGSASTLNTGKVLRVFRSDGDIKQPCRRVTAGNKGRYSDPEDMNYATITDPIFFIENNSLDALPVGGSCTYSEVAYPAVLYSASSIAIFPDEAEYLVALYGAIKSLQCVLGNTVSNTAIDTTAFGAVVTSVANAEDEIEDGAKMVANIVLGVAEVTESAVDTDTGSSEMQTAADAINIALDRIATYNWEDSDTFATGSAQLTRVKAALDNAEDVINSNQPSATTDAYGAQNNEDIELLQGALSIASAEIQRAKTHLSEWSSILQAASTEAQGFANEVQSRCVWTAAKAQVWNGYFASAAAYAQAAQTYLASANGYLSEAKIRMERDAQIYQWYEKQQVKLQQDYEKGIQMLLGARA